MYSHVIVRSPVALWSITSTSRVSKFAEIAVVVVAMPSREFEGRNGHSLRACDAKGVEEFILVRFWAQKAS